MTEYISNLAKTIPVQPYPLLFATVSGSHLYGFPSPDSDFDLRGVHILPLPKVIGLISGEETIEVSEVREGVQPIRNSRHQEIFSVAVEAQRLRARTPVFAANSLQYKRTRGIKGYRLELHYQAPQPPLSRFCHNREIV